MGSTYISAFSKLANAHLYTSHLRVFFQGVIAFGMVATLFLLALEREMPESEVRALTFFSLVTAIVALIFVNRSFSASLIATFHRPSRALLLVLILVPTMLGVTLLWPVARNLFRFEPLHIDDLAVTVGAGIAILITLELSKLLFVGWTKAQSIDAR